MGEQRIQKRQQRIHVVKRRSPIPLGYEKIVLLFENQLVQYAKVKFCTISLDAAKRIRIKTGINALEIFNQQRVTETNFIVIDYIPMVTDTSSKNRPAVDDFSYDEAPGEIQRLLCIVSFSILSTPQENIAPNPSMNAPRNFPCGVKKERPTLLSVHSRINWGLAPIYPKQTIPSILCIGIRNFSTLFILTTTLSPSRRRYDSGVVTYNVFSNFLMDEEPLN